MNSKTFVYKLIQFFNQCSPAGCLEAWPAVGSFDNVFFKEPRAAVGIWYALSNSNEGNRIWYTEWMELFGLRRNLLSSNVWWIKIKTLETFPYPPESLSYSASQPVPGPRNDNISHLFKLNKQPKEGRKEGGGEGKKGREKEREGKKRRENFIVFFRKVSVFEPARDLGSNSDSVSSKEWDLKTVSLLSYRLFILKLGALIIMFPGCRVLLTQAMHSFIIKPTYYR